MSTTTLQFLFSTNKPMSEDLQEDVCFTKMQYEEKHC